MPAPSIRAYAAKTRVPVIQSRHELEALLERHGATEQACLVSAERIVVGFVITGRKYRFEVPAPSDEQEHRQRWRAVLLTIKAKLELVRIGQSTIEREFLADLVLPDGSTAGETIGVYMQQLIERGYQAPLALPEGT